MIEKLIADELVADELSKIQQNMNFQETFLMNWRNGEKSFTWNNVIYTTEREDNRTIEDAR